MIVILVLISLLGVVAAVALPGWSDLLLLSGPCLLASLALMIRCAEIRLPAPRDAMLAALAWPLALGALGLVLIVFVVSFVCR